MSGILGFTMDDSFIAALIIVAMADWWAEYVVWWLLLRWRRFGP